MYLTYENKKTEKEILNLPASELEEIERIGQSNTKNLLIQGDNLKVMKYLLNQGLGNTLDLVYIDPPFATNTIFRYTNNRTSTISYGNSDEIAYKDTFALTPFYVPHATRELPTFSVVYCWS